MNDNPVHAFPSRVPRFESLSPTASIVLYHVCEFDDIVDVLSHGFKSIPLEMVGGDGVPNQVEGVIFTDRPEAEKWTEMYGDLGQKGTSYVLLAARFRAAIVLPYCIAGGAAGDPAKRWFFLPGSAANAPAPAILEVLKDGVCLAQQPQGVGNLDTLGAGGELIAGIWSPKNPSQGVPPAQ